MTQACAVSFTDGRAMRTRTAIMTSTGLVKEGTAALMPLGHRCRAPDEGAIVIRDAHEKRDGHPPHVSQPDEAPACARPKCNRPKRSGTEGLTRTATRRPRARTRRRPSCPPARTPGRRGHLARRDGAPRGMQRRRSRKRRLCARTRRPRALRALRGHDRPVLRDTSPRRRNQTLLRPTREERDRTRRADQPL